MKPMLSQRARSLITGVCRLVLAVVFIVSGFTKVIDPWGTSIKINEYLTIYGFDYLIPASMVFSIWLCGAELMMGCMLLFKVRIRLISIFALASMIFFTLLTLLSVAGCTYVMGIPGAADVMLGYQSTSFHDVHYVRQALGLLQQLGITGALAEKQQRGLVRVAPGIDGQILPDAGCWNGDGMWQPIGPKLMVSGHESDNQKKRIHSPGGLISSQD